VSGVAAGYIDPSAGFPITGQSGSALTTAITIPQASTTFPVQFALGTVAGTWTVTLTSLTSPAGNVLATPTQTMTVNVSAAVPTIVANSVKITALNSTGFTVQLDGITSIRALTSATFLFNAASGATLQRAGPVTVSFSGTDQSQWFATPASQASGGQFSLKVPFSFSGTTSALSTVTVTLTNANGPSASVTGGQ